MDTESLLAGELNQNLLLGVNMKKLIFYVCPECGNIVSSLSEGEFSCCSRKLEALKPIKASEDEKLTIETNDGEVKIGGNVDGNVSTYNGNVNCHNINGDVQTHNGNINKSFFQKLF